jgi:hypothetical protein
MTEQGFQFDASSHHYLGVELNIAQRCCRNCRRRRPDHVRG